MGPIDGARKRSRRALTPRPPSKDDSDPFLLLLLFEASNRPHKAPPQPPPLGTLFLRKCHYKIKQTATFLGVSLIYCPIFSLHVCLFGALPK